MSTQSPTTSFTPFNSEGGQARSFQERRSDSHVRQNETTLSWLQYLKLTLRVIGAVVCFLFFISEGVLVFVGEDFDHPSFQTFCRWISQALLGILIGVAGMYLEIRGSMTSVASNLMKHALNRLAVAVFYFWMGCYIVAKDFDGWKVPFQYIAAVLAWLVALGDLIVVCAPQERREEDFANDAGGVPARGSVQARAANELGASPASKQAPLLPPSSQTGGFPDTQVWATGPAAAEAAMQEANPFGAEDLDVSGVALTANFGQASPTSAEAGPAGGEWNSAAFGRSFGSS